MLVFEEYHTDVVWYVKIYPTIDVVPRLFDPAEEGPCPIDCIGVVFLKG